MQYPTCSQKYAIVFEPDRGYQLAEESLGDDRGIAVLAHFRADDYELIAGEAANGVGRADHPAQAIGDVDQHLVASVVAEPVVDPFKVIEIDKQYGETGCADVATAELVLEPIDQQRSVGKPGERTV